MQSQSQAPTPTPEQVRFLMLYWFRIQDSATRAASEINKAYPNIVTSRTCQRWFKRFREGDFSLEDRPRSGRPQEVDNDRLLQLLDENPRVTTEELAMKFKCSKSTIFDHLHSLGKKNRAGRWVPHELTDNNRAQRLSICTSLLLKQRSEPFLDRMVTGDEKWILYDNVTMKKQWLSPRQSPAPTARRELHQRKVLLSVWWDIQGIIHYELLEPGRTITAEVYCEQLDRLKSAIDQKRPALANRKGVVFHHDNARPHTARITLNKLSEFGWELLPQPPYSPDIAPSDYHLFRSMAHYLNGKKFTNNGQVDEFLRRYFFEEKSQEFYRRGIEVLPERWEKVIENQGEYFDDGTVKNSYFITTITH